MRHGVFVFTLLFVAAFAIGYAARSEENVEKMKKETKEAAESAKDYAFAQKAEFVEKMKSELAEINARIDKLSKKAEKAGDATRDEAKSRLQALRDQAAKLNKQLDEANNIVEANWADFKAGVNKSCGDMKDSFKQSRRWLSQKIAP
jgi:small-conductance mechanosensitive channel